LTIEAIWSHGFNEIVLGNSLGYVLDIEIGLPFVIRDKFEEGQVDLLLRVSLKYFIANL